MNKTHDESKGANQFRREGHVACVSQGIHIKGQISGNADLVVDGSVDGPIQLPDGQLTVGVSGQIAGDVVARDAIIHGKVNGNLRVRDRLEIKFDGSIVGNVTSGRIFIEEGAFFKGSIESGPEEPQATGFAQSKRSVAASAGGQRNP